MKVLQALPEIEVETLLSLVFLPEFCEFVYVTAAISKEELAHVLIEVLVSLIVIRNEIYGFGKLGTVILAHFAYMNKFEAILIDQELDLDIKLLHSIFILLSRISDKLF